MKKIKSMTTAEAVAYLNKVLKWTEFINHHQAIKIAIEQILNELNKEI